MVDREGNIQGLLALFHAPSTLITYLLPEGIPESQAGACSHKPAVPQAALVQVMGADSIHKQVGVFAEILAKKIRGYCKRSQHASASYPSSHVPHHIYICCSPSQNTEFLYQEIQKCSGIEYNYKSGYTELFKFLM